MGTIWVAVASATLTSGDSRVSLLQAGNWARVSIRVRHSFCMHITTNNWHNDSVP